MANSIQRFFYINSYNTNSGSIINAIIAFTNSVYQGKHGVVLLAEATLSLIRVSCLFKTLRILTLINFFIILEKKKNGRSDIGV